MASDEGEDDQSNRYLLTREIANLLHQTQQLYQVLDLTIEKAKAAGAAQHRQQQQQQTEEEEEEGEESHSEESSRSGGPLAREEIAKLLLLVSRAHGIGQLTDQQKSNLKMEVCLRKSYLRTILKQQDITQIMAALAEAGGGP